MTGLDGWIAAQRTHAIAGLLRSISSPVIKTRDGFGQEIIPRKGSVVASPVRASYDPDPDYFFHWYRDSALVMDALRLVRAAVPEAGQYFADFVDFSLGLARLDGRKMPPDVWAPVAADFTRFLRRDIAAAYGEAIAAETRVNPDGTLDITDWPRPQHDGPALRALTLLRWGVDSNAQAALLQADLHFILHHALKPCFDIWEEEKGLHYYTLRVSAAALRAGAHWLGDTPLAARCLVEAETLCRLLETYWSPQEGFIRSRVLETGRSVKELDIAVILAANHAREAPNANLMATLDRLVELFGTTYPINRPPTIGPAMGRYRGDTYYAGGAYYFATLGAAEFCYRSGARHRGDAFLETVRRFAPETGMMSEQFDQKTGTPASAKDLAWSYAAFLTCIGARSSAA